MFLTCLSCKSKKLYRTALGLIDSEIYHKPEHTAICGDQSTILLNTAINRKEVVLFYYFFDFWLLVVVVNDAEVRQTKWNFLNISSEPAKQHLYRKYKYLAPNKKIKAEKLMKAAKILHIINQPWLLVVVFLANFLFLLYIFGSSISIFLLMMNAGKLQTQNSAEKNI